MLPSLHLFFPENDIALAHNIERYTPPIAAVKLRRAGATLPLWYGTSGDMVVLQGVNSRWLETIKSKFDIGVDIFNHQPEGMAAAPWGWSKSSRQVYFDLGFDKSQLPDDNMLDTIRALSHRRTAAEVARRLSAYLDFEVAPPAQELADQQQVKEFVDSQPNGVVVKMPWSSSGRGVFYTDTKQIDSQLSMFVGMIKRQKSVMGEPKMKKKIDFAMLFTMSGGICRFDGYSLFNTANLGSYTGNILAPQKWIEDTIANALPIGQLDAVKRSLPLIIQEEARGYTGPLGVDMMVVENDAYSLAPVVEINFRMTMGHVCRIVYDCHIVDGRRGTFRVLNNTPETPSGIVAVDTLNGRIDHGTIDLAQPGSDFSFRIDIE